MIRSILVAAAFTFGTLALTERPFAATALEGVSDTREEGFVDQPELFYALPLIAFEYVNISPSALGDFTPSSVELGSDNAGLAYGGHLGFSLDILRVGAMYQRAQIFAARAPHFDKVYAELGIGGRWGIVEATGIVAGGYSFFGAEGSALTHGAGGRAAIAVDFHLGRWFTVGPEAAADVVGYFQSAGRYTAWGVTVGLRLGVYL